MGGNSVFVIPVLADPQLNTPSRAVTAESKSSTAPRGVQMHYAVLVPQRLYIQAVHRALLTRRCGPIFLVSYTLCLNETSRNIGVLCRRGVLARYERSLNAAAMKKSMAVKFDLGARVSHLRPLEPPKSNKIQNHSAKVFLKFVAIGRQRESDLFGRSYHVLSSNSRQRHCCQTRVPCARAAAAAASAPSGRRPEALTPKGINPEAPGIFFPTRPAAFRARCSAPSSRASTSPHL